MPVSMYSPQAVVMGEKVYVGGGHPKSGEDRKQVFQYNPSSDEWSHLPPCQVNFVAMAQFEEKFITVGGILHGGGYTGKVYRFRERSQKWVEFLKPMPTCRAHLSVATTKSAIVASGGFIGVRDGKRVPCANVEVYSSETAQWHTAEPLPVPCWAMTSVTIADTWYQLGGIGADGMSIPTVLYAHLTTLIQRAISLTHPSASHMTVWKTLPDNPLKESAAASVNENLIAVGGWDDDDDDDDKTPASRAVHIFFPLTNSWVWATTGDLPVLQYSYHPTKC